MESDRFSFFLSGEKKEVFPGSRLWEFPLSGRDAGSSCPVPLEHTPQNPVVTIGDYFSASCRFLSGNDFSIVKTGLEAVFKRPVFSDQIDRIIVFLEKHGAFYHPLRIQVALHGCPVCFFVLNGAVSKPGLALMKKEYQLISHLNEACSKGYLPRVFGVDVISTDKGKIGFFLGEWFEGYKEFHVTEHKGMRQIVIWESDGSCRYISEAEALPVYREISRILTSYYDIETFEQIFPWHHAAGDFIVKKEGGKVQVRLITVRGYASLTEFGGDEGENSVYILPGLLLFCLNLTIRMRLDRLDGTGAVVMLESQVLKPILEGFLTALDEKSAAYEFGDLRSIFISFFRQFSLEQLLGVVENVLESYLNNPEEFALVQENIESHCRMIHSVFSGL